MNAQNLRAGQSTIVDAAAAYSVPVARVIRLLAEALTDVYTPEGDGGVISKGGRTHASVTGQHDSDTRYAAADLALASDSLHMLASAFGQSTR